MPLLARLLPAPVAVDVRHGALAGLGALLADRRIATEGRVAVAVGPGQHGTGIAARLQLDEAEVFRVEAATVDSAVHLGKRLRAGCLRGGGRHRRRPDHRRDQVRRAHGRHPHGVGGHEPRS